MPKGSKKRKNAKKKMENQSEHKQSAPASAPPVGDEYVKHNDERDSDAGEISLPAPQDHHNPLTVVGGEEIEKNNEGSRSNEKVVEKRELEVGVESDGKEGRGLDHDEMEKGKSHCGGSSSSSGSSSDDEVHGIDNGQDTEVSYLVSDSVMVAEPSSGKTIEAVHSVHVEEVEKSIQPVCSESVLFLDEQVRIVDEHTCSVKDEISASLKREDATIDQFIEKISTVVSFKAPNSSNERDPAVIQPLLAPSPSPVQKTSWKNCCGLFEVFSGSGR